MANLKSKERYNKINEKESELIEEYNKIHNAAIYDIVKWLVTLSSGMIAITIAFLGLSKLNKINEGPLLIIGWGLMVLSIIFGLLFSWRILKFYTYYVIAEDEYDMSVIGLFRAQFVIFIIGLIVLVIFILFNLPNLFNRNG